jgi:hypothetical protein
MKSRSARRSEQRQERKAWRGAAVADPSIETEPVGDEERLMILRMLEEKKISLEQAEELLSALEGAGE